MSTTTEEQAVLDAATDFAEFWADPLLAAHLAEKLTCGEADALVGLLTALGCDGAAKEWSDYHALGDGPEDSHFEGGESE